MIVGHRRGTRETNYVMTEELSESCGKQSQESECLFYNVRRGGWYFGLGLFKTKSSYSGDSRGTARNEQRFHYFGTSINDKVSCVGLRVVILYKVKDKLK